MSDSIPEPPDAAWFARGIIERRKLEDYLLSPTHPEGRDKFRLWRSVFGIQEGDAGLLERLIREQLSQASPEEREPRARREQPTTTYRRWELIVPNFRGPNGNVGPVLTAWALDSDRDLPHLTTARPIIGR